jgi:hypothetical protein
LRREVAVPELVLNDPHLGSIGHGCSTAVVHTCAPFDKSFPLISLKSEIALKITVVVQAALSAVLLLLGVEEAMADVSGAR